MVRAFYWQILFTALGVPLLAGPAAAYVADHRWTSTATNGSVGSIGSVGLPVTLTWSFAPDGTQVPDGGSGSVGSDLLEFLDATWGAGTGGSDLTQRPWFFIFQQSFDRLGEASGLTFVYEPFDDGVALSAGSSGRGVLRRRGDIRLSGKSYGGGTNVLASNYYPNFGDMMINTDKGGFFDNSANNHRAFRNTLMHELMHGLGISHVDSSTSAFLIEPTLGTSFDGPQLDDLLAIQRLYGDAFEENGGNDSLAGATAVGALQFDQPVTLGNARNSTVITADERQFLSIDDDTDVDYFSFTLNEKANVRVGVDPRGASYMAGPEDQPQQSLNALALNNLALSLLADNGTRTVNAVDATGAGSGEAIWRQLDPGTYHVRINGPLDDIQLYQLQFQASAPTPRDLTWTGAANAAWEVDASQNFDNGVNPDVFRTGDHVTFDDSGPQTVTIVGDVSAGIVTVNTADAYVFDGAGSLVGGSLQVDGGGLVTLATSGNSYSGPTTVIGGTLAITGDANAMASPITIRAGAAVVMNPSDAAAIASTFDVEEGGVLDIGVAPSPANVFADDPAPISNNGLIRVFNAERLSHISGSGEISFLADGSDVQNNPAFDGTIQIGAAARLTVYDGAGLGTAAGPTAVEAGGALLADFDGELQDEISLATDGASSATLGAAAARAVDFKGQVVLHSGGALQAAAASTATFAGVRAATGAASLTLDAAEDAVFELDGPVDLDGGDLIKIGVGEGKLSDGSVFAGRARIQAGALRLGGAVPYAGEFIVSQSAELRTSPGVALGATARIEGDGSVAGPLDLAGTAAPGAGVGMLTVAGDLTTHASAVFVMELAGLAAGTEYDVIDVAGAASLSGTLRVELTDGFLPGLGQSFDLLTAAELTGRFDALEAPGLAEGLQWRIDQTSRVLTLSVATAASTAAADFNGDGSVDGADLADWQSVFGAQGAEASADANGDLQVDGVDFLAWQQQYFTPAPLQAVVPEPCGLVACGLALAACAAHRRTGSLRRAVI
ncbi:MAG: hypothetical protein DCC67_12990 [Planctomycetota bacterium]|nr:MAG: hypothetical protein DCC67_12990 [Planctomycetota bacterium]